jgi:predicted nucleic acid-binding protein
MEAAARKLTLTDPPPNPGTHDLHQAWSTAINIANARNLPLWSDDFALRSIAADQGIPAFGTYALLAALIQAGLVPDTMQEDMQALAEARVVVLPKP